MKMIATLFVVFAFASSAFAFPDYRGFCPYTHPAPGVDVGKIAGRWYEIAGPTEGEYPVNYPCMTLDFTPRTDGNYSFTIIGTNYVGSKHEETVLAKRTDRPDSLHVYHQGPEYPITFYIADTDYDNYLAIYTCYYDLYRSSLHSALILSRNNTMSADKYSELADLLVDKFHTPSNKFAPINQKDCQYWPVSQ